MDKIDLICPQCGANLTVNEDHTKAKCSYCGFTSLIKKEESLEDLSHRLEELSYANEKGEMRAALEAEKVRSRRSKTSMLITIGVIALAIYIFIKVNDSKKVQVNPFDYVNVSFNGTTGQGIAKMKIDVNDEDINPYDIDYEIKPTEKLEEGDKVTVTAKSSIYKLQSEKKVYQVEGLDLFLSDINELSEDAMNAIHTSASETIDMALSYAGKNNVSIEKNNFATYLLTNKKDNNILYDVFEVNFEMDGQTSTIYMATYFENVITRGKSGNSIDYGRTMYKGNTIAVFDGNVWSPYVTGYRTLEGAIGDFKTNQMADMEFQERQ